jgi:hypothetical protein
MLLIAGTIPIRDFPLSLEKAVFEGGILNLNGLEVPCGQGTGAMLAAASVTLDYLGLEPSTALLVGDIGEGNASRLLYEHLIEKLPVLSPEVLALHYWLPDVALMKKLCETIEKCPKKPKLIADAASMYAAKAAGLAPKFDLLTPDPSEIAFLADPDAFHPAYINKHLFNTDASQVPNLVAQAYQVKGAAKVLLVKGPVDYIVKDGEILETISEPNLPVMEAIGGTGDTITGLVSAFVYAGLELHEAAIIAAKANRMAGKFAQATPATNVWQIINQFPAVFRQYLCNWSGVCYIEGGSDHD